MFGAFFRGQTLEITGENFGGAENEGQRGADLMGNHGDEIAFETVQIFFFSEGDIQLGGAFGDFAFEVAIESDDFGIALEDLFVGQLCSVAEAGLRGEEGIEQGAEDESADEDNPFGGDFGGGGAFHAGEQAPFTSAAAHGKGALN